MKLNNAEIALAMELRTEGGSWKTIAYGVGVSLQYLFHSVEKAKREGMKVSARERRLAA